MLRGPGKHHRSAPAHIDLSVGLNTTITNRAFGPPSFVDAVVLVDDPAPSEQRFAPVFPGSLISFTGQAISDGKPLNFHAGNVPNAYQAYILNANSIGFSGIPVDGLQHNFRIANVRANASQVTNVDIAIRYRFSTKPGRRIRLKSTAS